MSTTADQHPLAGAEPLGVASIRAAVAPVLARLADGSRQREGTRDYAFEEVRELAAQRIALTGIAREDGGAGGSVRDVADLVIAIARADSNVAQALRGSFVTADVVATHGDPASRERTLERLRAGELFAISSNDRSGGGIALREVGGELVLSGKTYYSTGALYAHWFTGLATDEAGRVVRFTVPLAREGVERLDDFDAVGQRLTASGTTALHDVRVGPDELARDDEPAPRNPWPGTFAQLHLAAIEAGIAAAALDDAVWFGRARARPIKHSSAERAVDDPYVQHVVGEIAARANAARAAVLLAAEVLGEVWRAPDEDVREAAAGAAVAVAQAQYVAVEAALRSGELLFDVGSGSATDRRHALDRHWRNARTVANHNPRRWKAAVAGRFHLSGEEPPLSGLF